MKSPFERRTILTSAAGLLLAAALPAASAKGKDQTPEKKGKPKPPGKPGDFDFLTGEWKIRHRQLKAGSPEIWDEFEGSATCWSILGGVAHVEELRIPARDFSGLGLRVLDVKNRVWSDYWMNAKWGVLGSAGVPGYFENGEGIFESEEMDGATPLLVRGTWDRITGKSHRWLQAASRDGGKTWKENWVMEWTKV